MVACLSTFGTGSQEGAGILHRIEVDLDGLHYQHILQNVTVPSVRMLYPDGIIHLQQEYSSILDSRVVQERVARRPTSKSLTGYCEGLIWTPSRKIGVRWKGQCRKPSLSSLPEITMSYGPLCQTRGMKLVRLPVTFDQWLTPWQDEFIQWSKHKATASTCSNDWAA